MEVFSNRSAINDGFFTKLMILVIFNVFNQAHIRRWMKQPNGVVLAFDRLCIKSSPFASLAEAHAMVFVSENTSIPVPKVYSAFEHRGRAYIVMEKLHGEVISRGWLKRSEESRSLILEHLKALLGQLRNIQQPQRVGVANVTGGPIFDQRLPRKSSWGPFATIQDFHKELRGGVEIHPELVDIAPDLGDLFAFHSQPWPDSVFTHGDLSSFNVLANGDKVTGIIDWECSGWMPPYWEYTSAWNVSPLNQFWQKEIDRFLEPWPVALRMESIRRKYFGDV